MRRWKEKLSKIKMPHTYVILTIILLVVVLILRRRKKRHSPKQ
mgnify:CR=1 FL=1